MPSLFLSLLFLVLLLICLVVFGRLIASDALNSVSSGATGLMPRDRRLRRTRRGRNEYLRQSPPSSALQRFLHFPCGSWNLYLYLEANNSAVAPPADALNSVSSEATDLTPTDRGLRRNERGRNEYLPQSPPISTLQRFASILRQITVP